MVSSDTPRRQQAEGCSGSRGGGRFVVLRLTVEGDIIRQVSFECNGCPSSLRAVGGLVEFLTNRKIEQAARLEASDLLILIGGLPDGKGYWADMAVEALHEALSNLHFPALDSGAKTPSSP